MQRNKISFKGQNIFVGIDVHLRKWHVTCLTESNFKRSIEQPASPEALHSYLKRTFPDGSYCAAYESGFTGFSTYHSLTKLGIKTIVVNAADVPATQYEKTMKTDRVDSERIAVALRAGQLRGIYIRKDENADDLSLVRLRKALKGEESASRTRIKLFLYTNGVTIPENLGQRWTAAYVDWLKSDLSLLSPTRVALDALISHTEVLHMEYMRVAKMVRDLVRSEKYKTRADALMSIPGIGSTTAITLLTEIGDVSRFRNERQFASYLGLIPSSHNSGDKVIQSTITFRGNKRIGAALTEAAWKSVSSDASLSAFFLKCRGRMNPQKAIVKVARKLSNIIFAIMKSGKNYEQNMS